MKLKLFVGLVAYAMLSFATIIFLFLKGKKKLGWVFILFNIVMIVFLILILSSVELRFRP
jgi:hypothetical protein